MGQEVEVLSTRWKRISPGFCILSLCINEMDGSILSSLPRSWNAPLLRSTLTDIALLAPCAPHLGPYFLFYLPPSTFTQSKW